MPNSTRNKTDLADTLLLHIRARGLPLPVREFVAIPGRKFRCDLAWPAQRICLEVDGGELMQGRHNRAQGMASDCEKQNLLVLAGWRCFRCTGTMVKDGRAIALLEEVFRAPRPVTIKPFVYPRDRDGFAMCHHGRRIACEECITEEEG